MCDYRERAGEISRNKSHTSIHTCPSVSLYVFLLSVRMSVALPLFLYVCLSLWISSVSVSVSLSIFLYLSVCLCLFFSLSIFLFKSSSPFFLSFSISVSFYLSFSHPFSLTHITHSIILVISGTSRGGLLPVHCLLRRECVRHQLIVQHSINCPARASKDAQSPRAQSYRLSSLYGHWRRSTVNKQTLCEDPKDLKVS